MDKNQNPPLSKIAITLNPLLLTKSIVIALLFLVGGCRDPRPAETLPDIFKQSGAFVKSLPYFNPDSCVLLVRRDVPPRWQGAAYENLFLDGPEDSPLALGFRHLDSYERNFPADTARAFAQLWRGLLGHPDTAQACLQESYDLSMKAKNYLRAGDAQEAMGAIFYRKGQTADALRSFFAVYEAVKNLPATQSPRKITAMTNISNAYHQSSNFREALAWAQRSWPMLSDESIESNRASKVDYFRQCGTIYSSLNLPDSAIFMLQKALDLQEKYQTINNRTILMSKLGGLFLDKGDCATALRHLLEASRNQAPDNASGKDELAMLKAETYFCLARLDSAEMLASPFLQHPFPPYRLHANKLMAEIYAQQGKYKAAYDAVQTRMDIGEKTYNIEKIQQMGAAKVEVELDRAKMHIEQLAQKEKNERQQKFIVALAALLALVLGVGVILQQRGQQRILEQEKQLAEAREVLYLIELENTRSDLQQSNIDLEQASKLLGLKNQIIAQMSRLSGKSSPSSDNISEILQPGEGNFQQLKIFTAEDWEIFQQNFEFTFPGMRLRVLEQFPELTNAELRLLLLLKIGLQNIEIANVLSISLESIWKSRYRLRKKMGMADNPEFEAWMRALV